MSPIVTEHPGPSLATGSEYEYLSAPLCQRGTTFLRGRGGGGGYKRRGEIENSRDVSVDGAAADSQQISVEGRECG